MEKTSGFWERLAARAELDTEPIPAQPIIEIGGDTRVLVENHRAFRPTVRRRFASG